MLEEAYSGHLSTPAEDYECTGKLRARTSEPSLSPAARAPAASCDEPATLDLRLFRLAPRLLLILLLSETSSGSPSSRLATSNGTVFAAAGEASGAGSGLADLDFEAFLEDFLDFAGCSPGSSAITAS
jgi:hypothetical protein